MTTRPLARHRLLAPTASAWVSPICLGAMTFGEAHPERYGVCDKETSFKILDTFFTSGGNFIDTACGYRDGQSEEWVGEWMISRDNRDQIFLATKYSGACRVAHPGNISSNWRGDGLKAMRLSIETSLKRLQTSFIDLFYLHAWDYTVSIPELMMGLNDLVSSGKVNYLGVSDTPAWVVAKANQYARDHGLRQFSVYQGMWNAGMRDFERDIIPMAMHEGMALAPYGTLGQGSFQTREGYAERAKSNPGRNLKPTSETDRKVSGVLEDLACERNDGTTLLNVALAYVMQKVPYVFPIVGARKVEHLEGSIQGLKVTLSQGEIERIENAVDFEHGFPTNFLNHALFDPASKNVMVLGPESVKHNMLPDFDYVKPPSAIRFTQ